MNKNLNQHESEFIHIPKLWGTALFLIAIHLIGTWLIYQDIGLAAAHGDELNELNLLNLIYCLGFTTLIYLIGGTCVFITIKLCGGEAGVVSSMVMALSLLLLPLAPLPLLLVVVLPLLLALALLMLLLPQPEDSQ